MNETNESNVNAEIIDVEPNAALGDLSDREILEEIASNVGYIVEVAEKLNEFMEAIKPIIDMMGGSSGGGNFNPMALLGMMK